MYSCFEGLCFEDEQGIYSTLKKCSTLCGVNVVTETKEDEREKKLDEVITDEQKEKEKIEQIENPLVPEAIKEQLRGSGGGDGETSESSGICPKGSYFCKTINECLPNEIVCPK